jgi:hypothetical protein
VQSPIGVALLLILLGGAGLMLIRPALASKPPNKGTRIASGIFGALILSMFVVVITVKL